jgi:hypothetical protein
MLLHRLPQPLTLTLTPTPFIPALNIRLAKPLQGEDGSLSFERRAWTRKEDEVLTLLYAKQEMPFRFVTLLFSVSRRSCGLFKSMVRFAPLSCIFCVAGGVGERK